MRCDVRLARFEPSCHVEAGRWSGPWPGTKVQGLQGPRTPPHQRSPPVLVTATATPAPTRRTPSSRFRERTAHQSMASIGAYPGPSSCISRDLSGLAFSPIGPGYAGLSGCCVSLPGRDGLPPLRPSSQLGRDDEEGLGLLCRFHCFNIHLLTATTLCGSPSSVTWRER